MKELEKFFENNGYEHLDEPAVFEKTSDSNR